MASSDHSSPKSSSSNIEIGDIIINALIHTDIWGIIVNIEKDPIKLEKRVVYLTGGRIAKLINYGTKWLAYSPKAYAAHVTKPEIVQEKIWQEIAFANLENENTILNVSPYTMRLFHLSIHPKIEFKNLNDYELHVVREMVVSAYNAKDAKAFALTHEQLDDSYDIWKDTRNICCKIIGISITHKMQIITVSREDYNA
jgi:hypothetical protein